MPPFKLFYRDCNPSETYHTHWKYLEGSTFNKVENAKKNLERLRKSNYQRKWYRHREYKIIDEEQPALVYE